MPRYAGLLAVLAACFAATATPAGQRGSVEPSPLNVARFATNPLVTVDSHPSLGKMVNGPAIIRVPAWVQKPLGRYYLYFANHRGLHIRLAYADAITGPWKVYEPGVLHVRETAFYRPQPDLSSFGGNNTHLASPEVYVDEANRRIVLWSHGWYSNGEHWPSDPAAARRWAEEKGYGQFTQAATSTDGLAFTAQPAITRESYLRVIRHGDMFYGVSRLGQLSRSADLLGAFESGPNIFEGSSYGTGRVRHVALLVRGTTLYVFFTAIGDAPERIMVSTVDMSRDWTTWRAGTPVEVLRPETRYECAELPVEKSAVGDIQVPVHQMRDPAIFEEGGKVYLLYVICGEQGIAGGELTGLP